MAKKWKLREKIAALRFEKSEFDENLAALRALSESAELISGQRDYLANLQRETDLALQAEKAKWHAIMARLRTHLDEPQVIVAHKITDTERMIAIMECIAIVEEYVDPQKVVVPGSPLP